MRFCPVTTMSIRSTFLPCHHYVLSGLVWVVRWNGHRLQFSHSNVHNIYFLYPWVSKLTRKTAIKPSTPPSTLFRSPHHMLWSTHFLAICNPPSRPPGLHARHVFAAPRRPPVPPVHVAYPGTFNTKCTLDFKSLLVSLPIEYWVFFVYVSNAKEYLGVESYSRKY